MNYFQQSWQLFHNQPKQRKMTLIIGLTAILVPTCILIGWALIPQYALLFNNLESRDANQILTQLEQANIAYKVSNQGRSISIAKPLVESMRIKLMGSNLKFTGSVGFELFDKSDFGLTDFSQKINYQRALQGELERTINSLDEIKYSRVHLVIPENHLFQTEALPTASVTLHLKEALNNQQVKSIQQLISASIAHLRPEQIVILDQNGNKLNATQQPENHQLAAKKSLELYLNTKVMQMLNRIFPAKDVIVKIDARLNYDELQRALSKPQTQGSIKHEKQSLHTIAGKKGKTPAKQELSSEKNYQIGSEKEQFTRAQGRIERLTISVAIPQYSSKQTTMQIERLVKSIVGFDVRRGDSISVEAIIKVAEPVTLDKTAAFTSAMKPPTAFSQWRVCALVFSFITVAMVSQIYVRRKRRKYLLNALEQWLVQHG